MLNKFVKGIRAGVTQITVEVATKTNKLARDERGGFSPLVVGLGLALIFAVILVTVSPTLRTEISAFITTIFDRLRTL